MVYVTSDLHGYPLESFKELLRKAEFSENDVCYVLGDVIDRGNEGIKTLRWMMSQPNVKLILGNHEAMMLDCEYVFDDPDGRYINDMNRVMYRSYAVWVSNGGMKTLGELEGVRDSEIRHIFDYLKRAPLYKTLTVGGRDFVLVHGGLDDFDKDKPLEEYSLYDLVWCRPSLTTKYYTDKITIFGHTPTVYYGEQYKGRAIFTETWINVDSGSAYGLAPMLLRLDDMKEFYCDV